MPKSCFCFSYGFKCQNPEAHQSSNASIPFHGDELLYGELFYDDEERIDDPPSIPITFRSARRLSFSNE